MVSNTGSMDISTIIVFAIIYYCVAVWTYGASVSGGLFIPNLLIGAAWGRLIGVCLQSIFPGAVCCNYVVSLHCVEFVEIECATKTKFVCDPNRAFGAVV